VASLRLDNSFLFSHSLATWCSDKSSQLQQSEPISGGEHSTQSLFCASGSEVDFYVTALIASKHEDPVAFSGPEEKIEWLWKKARQELQAPIVRYKNGLGDHADKAYAARRIQLFCESNSFFKQFLLEDNLHPTVAKINGLFQQACSRKLFECDAVELLCDLREAYASTCIEGILQMEHPIRALSSLAKDEEPDANEKKALGIG
jgi:hypothetical protein